MGNYSMIIQFGFGFKFLGASFAIEGHFNFDKKEKLKQLITKLETFDKQLQNIKL